MGAGKDLWMENETRYNAGSAWALLYASDAVLTDPTGCYEGRETIQAYADAADKPFSDHRLETSLLIEEGDTVVAEYTWRGRHTGPVPMPNGTEIPATGNMVELPIVSVIRVKDGTVATERDYFDNVAMMTQLGLMPGS